MSTLRLFVSSVQRELESERLAVAELIASDSFLHKHCEAILFEQVPASTLPADSAYIRALESCDVYAGILGFEYGATGSDGLSATHREYLRAEQRRMPVLMFVKGSAERDRDRDPRTLKLLDLVRDAAKGHTYRRFQNAVAHRDYGLSGSSIRVEKYADRILVLSPGLPPPPVTLEKIRALRYLPCSRNPNLARGLSMFERIEEQG